MLKLVALILVAALAASASIQAAPSQPPIVAAGPQSSTVQSPASANQQKTKAEEQNAAKSPLTLKAPEPPKTQAQADWEADYNERSTADNNAKEIGVTGVVVGVLQTIALVMTFLVIAYVAVSQLRAYVYPSVEAIKSFCLPKPVVVTINWKNAGLTPARRFESHGCVFAAQIPLPDKIDFGPGPTEPPGIGRHARPAIYPATVQKSDWTLPDGESLVPDVAKAIKEGKLGLYIAGAAHYRDIFGFKRTTQFCQYMDQSCAAQIIEACEKAAPISLEVLWIASHVLNDFT